MSFLGRGVGDVGKPGICGTVRGHVTDRGNDVAPLGHPVRGTTEGVVAR